MFSKMREEVNSITVCTSTGFQSLVYIFLIAKYKQHRRSSSCCRQQSPAQLEHETFPAMFDHRNTRSTCQFNVVVRFLNEKTKTNERRFTEVIVNHFVFALVMYVSADLSSSFQKISLSAMVTVVIILVYYTHATRRLNKLDPAE